MKKTVVIYGSTTGSCEDYANRIASKLGADVFNVTDVDGGKVEAYDNLLLGTSTWGEGDVQDDWYDGVKVLESANLKGRTVAIFGCGDAMGYPDSFCGGMAEIYRALKDSGANILGMVSAGDYNYGSSQAVIDGKFVGLAIDINEMDSKTEERIDKWIEEIKPSL